ncbi:MAG: threonine/serine dehydratase [Cyclobacteriaceae bacterium]|nr:threonine/serine dehydratase [Cyclobacteriaceae bacterium]
MELSERIIDAEKRIRPYLRETPLEYSHVLSRMTGSEVHLKLENIQITGSFKARGSLNKILLLKDSKAKIVTASTGNHGLGVANALSIVKKDGTIYLPHGASESKVEAIKMRGVPVEFHGNNSEETELYVRKLSETSDQVYVSPYNDVDVVAGQGTIGVELMRQLPKMDAVFISVGGGGLIAGIAAYLKSVNPKIEVVACFPENSPVMYECIKAGEIIEVAEKPTLSDGTAGGIEKGTITFEICQRCIDTYVLVTEDEIAESMKLVLKHHHQIIEGSAGVAVASLIKMKDNYKNKNSAILICGGNVSEAVLKKLMCNG